MQSYSSSNLPEKLFVILQSFELACDSAQRSTVLGRSCSGGTSRGSRGEVSFLHEALTRLWFGPSLNLCRPSILGTKRCDHQDLMACLELVAHAVWTRSDMTRARQCSYDAAVPSKQIQMPLRPHRRIQAVVETTYP